MFNSVSGRTPTQPASSTRRSEGARSGQLESRNIEIARARPNRSGASSRAADRSVELGNRSLANARSLERPPKPYLSSTDALALVSSGGMQPIKQRWTEALNRDVSLDTFVTFTKSPSRRSKCTVNGQEIRHGVDYSRSDDPFIAKPPGRTPTLELPSLTRNTQLIIAEQYSNKYGVEIRFVSDRISGIDMSAVADGVINDINTKGKAGLVVPAAVGQPAESHSIPILFTRVEDDLHVHVLDTSFHATKHANLVDEYFPHKLVEQIETSYPMKVTVFQDTTGRQSELTGCHADSLVVLKDGLRSPKPYERQVSDVDGTTKVKTSMMKTTQRSAYWESQNIQKNEVYNSDKGRTIQEHIDKHSVKQFAPIKFTPLNPNITRSERSDLFEVLRTDENGVKDEYLLDGPAIVVATESTRNMFLRLKSISLIDRAVSEMSDKTADQLNHEINNLKSKRTLG